VVEVREGAGGGLAGRWRELADELFPAARVFILELHARRPQRISFGRFGHAGLLEPPRRRLCFLCELLTLVGGGPIAASGADQRTRTLRGGEAEMARRETAHRKPDNVSLVDLQRVEHGTNIVACSILRVTLPLSRHVRRWVSPRIVGDAAISARKIANLWFP